MIIGGATQTVRWKKKQESVFPVITRERRYPLRDWKWSIRRSKTVGNSRSSVELLWNRFCNLCKQLNPARNIRYYARVQWKLVVTTPGVSWGSVVILRILILHSPRDLFFGDHFCLEFSLCRWDRHAGAQIAHAFENDRLSYHDNRSGVCLYLNTRPLFSTSLLTFFVLLHSRRAFPGPSLFPCTPRLRFLCRENRTLSFFPLVFFFTSESRCRRD